MSRSASCIARAVFVRCRASPRTEGGTNAKVRLRRISRGFAMSHDPNKKGPEARVTEAVPAPPYAPSDRGTGLKLVGVRPAADSLTGEVPSQVAPYPIQMQSMASALIGYTIDNRYKVESVLGEGGMGVVYRCRHKIIDK